jgi:stage III sporulation protein AH
MLLLKKKQIVLGALVVLLVAAVYTNYRFFNNTKETAETDNPLNAELVSNMDEESIMGGSVKISESFFTDYRIERERTRGENIETLEGIVESEDASAETINAANLELVAIVQLSEQELLWKTSSNPRVMTTASSSSTRDTSTSSWTQRKSRSSRPCRYRM